MNTESNAMDSGAAERAQSAALNKIDNSQKAFRWLTAGACLVEGVFLVLVIMLADFGNDLHLLILACSFLVYMTLGMCLIALAAYVKLNALRVMRHVESAGLAR